MRNVRFRSSGNCLVEKCPWNTINLMQLLDPKLIYPTATL